jgi:hypothetical protein
MTNDRARECAEELAPEDVHTRVWWMQAALPIIQRHLDDSKAELKEALEKAQERITELSAKVANEHRLYELTFDNQTRWMDKCGEAEKQLTLSQQRERELVKLVVHGYVHDNYPDFGFLQMTTEQKLLYLSILKQNDFTNAAERLEQYVDKAKAALKGEG